MRFSSLFFLAIVFLSSLPQAWAQLPNLAFYEDANRTLLKYNQYGYGEREDNPFRKSDLFADISVLSFARNNEYFTHLQDGETFLGYQLLPHILWEPSMIPELTIRGGIFLHKNLGQQGFDQRKLVFSSEYNVKNWRFIIGTLYGGLEHELIEPLYRFERGLTNRIEEGIQIKHLSKKWSIDLWVDWQQIAKPEINQPEIFTPGLSVKYKPFKVKNKVTPFEFFAQATNYHRGGSRITLPVINRSNAGAGFRFEQALTPVSTLYIEPWIVFAIDHSPILTQPYRNGHGAYLNSTIHYKGLYFMLSYWYGREFFSMQGAPLFASFNNENYTQIDRERSLLFGRIMYEKKLSSQLHTSLRCEPVYEIYSKKMHYSFGLYLMYRIGT